jgi:hypothetical protein
MERRESASQIRNHRDRWLGGLSAKVVDDLWIIAREHSISIESILSALSIDINPDKLNYIDYLSKFTKAYHIINGNCQNKKIIDVRTAIRAELGIEDKQYELEDSE